MSRVPTTPSPASPFSRVQPKSFRAPGDQPFRATDLFLPRRPAVPARNKVSRPCPTHESSFAHETTPRNPVFTALCDRHHAPKKLILTRRDRRGEVARAAAQTDPLRMRGARAGDEGGPLSFRLA